MSVPDGKQAKKRRLGKGLSAIVGDPVRVRTPQAPSDSGQSAPDPTPSRDEPATAGSVKEIDLDAINTNKNQPRSRFDDSALGSLAESIRAVGVIQPVVVRPLPGGRFELIAGERRVRACRLAGLETVPAVIKDCDDRTSAEAALIENLQREDLNPIERSEAIRGLIDSFGLTQKEVAERVGLERSSVSNLLRLGELETPIKEILIEGLLGMGHGRALLAIPPGEARTRLAERSVREGWSVRRLETAARDAAGGGGQNGGQSGGGANTKPGTASPDTADLERRLGDYLGTKVQVKSDPKGRGNVVIRFFDLDHFDDLMARIGYRNDSEL